MLICSKRIVLLLVLLLLLLFFQLQNCRNVSNVFWITSDFTFSLSCFIFSISAVVEELAMNFIKSWSLYLFFSPLCFQEILSLKFKVFTSYFREFFFSQRSFINFILLLLYPFLVTFDMGNVRK